MRFLFLELRVGLSLDQSGVLDYARRVGVGLVGD
jgi:hypothetical protein